MPSLMLPRIGCVLSSLLVLLLTILLPLALADENVCAVGTCVRTWSHSAGGAGGCGEGSRGEYRTLSLTSQQPVAGTTSVNLNNGCFSTSTLTVSWLDVSAGQTGSIAGPLIVGVQWHDVDGSNPYCEVVPFVFAAGQAVGTTLDCVAGPPPLLPVLP